MIHHPQRTIVIRIELKIPLRLVSEANLCCHWTKKHKRKKKIAALLLCYWPKEKIVLPCTVTLTRVAPRMLDFDNLVHANKHLFDKICDLLRPGLAPGQADNTDLIEVVYKQEKGKPKEYAVKILIESK